MNKPLLLSLVTASILTSTLTAESMYERIESMEVKMKELQNEITTLKASKLQTLENEKPIQLVQDTEVDEEEDDTEERISDLEENISDLNKATNGSHLKFKADYRFSADNLQYKMADGSKQGNSALLANRLWIRMDWKATENLSFSSQLAYNKTFGARSGWNFNVPAMERFDWITNENAYDDTLKVRSAYFLYKNDTFMGTEIPWTFSIGRRPSTNGHLINLRDDDEASSPMGHSINVEFDGISSKFSFEDLTGIDGSYIKFCAGRGGTNANPKFFSVDPNSGAIANAAPYSSNEDDIGDIDLIGLIFVPYNDGQYGIATQYYYANNLIDADISYPAGVPTMSGMKTVGGMHSFTTNITVNGIGNEWSDFLDDTIFFVSGAISVTDPKDDQGMLGSRNGESRTGYSAWVGLQMPSLVTEDGKWGLEYNKGSAYWRSITYAEDTDIGSKLATRGDAYEVYFTEPLIDDILSLQVRYTYIDYKYTGSNGFFGNSTGSARAIDNLTPATGSSIVVDKAQDIRFYLRYRY